MKKRTKEEIIEIISNASVAHSSEIWWASGIASKNRFHKELNLLLSRESFNIKLFHFFATALRQIITALHLFSKILYIRFSFYSKATSIKKQVQKQNYIIVKSFAYKSSFNNNLFIDPFFKDFIPLLKQKNYQIIHIVDSGAKLKTLIYSTDKVLPHLYFLNPVDVIVSLLKLYLEFFKYFLKKTNTQSEERFESALNNIYLLDLLTGQVLSNLLFSKIGINLVKFFKNPHSVLFTYENNSWERMFCAGIKKENPHIRLYAFQHSVMPDASINMYLGKKEAQALNQIDKIFTSGNYPSKLLKKYSNFPSNKIVTLGTTRYQYIHHLSEIKSTKSEYEIILTLEGVPEAAEIINRFLTDCASMNSYPKALIRFHPTYGFEKMKYLFKSDIKTWKNISISEEPDLLKDIQKSDFVIYWGSACSLEAIKIGKPVINVKMKTFLDYDPLKELNSFKINWHYDQNIINLIQEFKSKSIADLKIEKGIAQAFIDDYFAIIDVLPENYF